MSPSEELRIKLRKMLNEAIPEGGSETDTNFADWELNDLLITASNIYIAAAMAWTVKAGLLKERIENYKVGQESYDKTSLKDMVDFALKMAKQYAEMGKEPGFTGKTKSGLIIKMKPPRVL